MITRNSVKCISMLNLLMFHGLIALRMLRVFFTIEGLIKHNKIIVSKLKWKVSKD